MIRLEVGSSSLVGQVRSANEDAYLAVEGLAAVADGMGGHRAGEVASADTIEALRTIQGSRSLDDLVRAVHLANRQVSERAEHDPDLAGMGTTVVVVGLVRRDGADEVAVLNVGDSRVYLLASGELHQLTEDHSLVETLVREGRLSSEEAAGHPQRNVLTRALGVEPLVVVDAWLLRPCDGDRLLLCSDGLTNELDDGRIAEILAEGDPPDVAARRLAAEADAAGGRDNVTTVVADVVDSANLAAPVGDRFRRITTPAVDLSDEPSGPHTETVMAVVSPPREDDDEIAPSAPVPQQEGTVIEGDPEIAALAGPGGAGAVVSDADQLAIAQAEAEAALARANRWRTAAFVFAIFGVIALAVVSIAFTARRGWYVADNEAGVVALYRGTPVLWLKPTEVEASELAVDDMTPADRRRVEGGSSFSSKAEARNMIKNLATTTTTSSTTTTTTMPLVTTAAPPPVTDPATGLPSPLDPNATTTTAVVGP